ncbi:rodlin [Streptomyces sp. NPDC052236]|uniref:rodlin n=1 Tax=Streptomyces sp. NPDC052236 TaxID=3365686 RepID=UPI0037CD4634
MLKKVMATAAITLSVAATGATMAPQAMAIGSEEETTALSGNGSSQAHGNFVTDGDLSAQAGLVQGTLNDPCIAIIPGKLNVGSVVGLIPITVQDILTSQQVQACADNSTQEKGDDLLSNILSNIPILTGNGVENE